MVQAQQVSAVARPLRTREAGVDDHEESIQPPIEEALTVPADIPELAQPVSPSKELELSRHEVSPPALLDVGLTGDASGSEASLIEHLWD